ncbi:MAG: hypothetical protein IJG94_03835 [Clostridia bacterium]|jgi:hypothetical protein|nr:hypothetical protein [Clostridia bacterium]
MKKLFALVMMLCLLCTAAVAEDASTMNWSDVEPTLAENNQSGEFVVLDQLGLKVWLPEGLNAVEVSEADAAAGRLALFTDADQTAYLAVDAMNVEGMTIDQYYENAKATEGLSDVEMITVNGLNAVVYKSETMNFWSASLVDTNSNIINFVMGPASEEGSQLVFSIILASLQIAE